MEGSDLALGGALLALLVVGIYALMGAVNLFDAVALAGILR